MSGIKREFMDRFYYFLFSWCFQITPLGDVVTGIGLGRPGVKRSSSPPSVMRAGAPITIPTLEADDVTSHLRQKSFKFKM